MPGQFLKQIFSFVNLLEVFFKLAIPREKGALTDSKGTPASLTRVPSIPTLNFAGHPLCSTN